MPTAAKPRNSPALVAELRATYQELLGIDVAQDDVDDVLDACRAVGIGDIVSSIFKNAGSVPGHMKKDGSLIKTVQYEAQRISRNYRIKQIQGPQRAFSPDALALVLAIAILALFLYPAYKVWAKRMVQEQGMLFNSLNKPE